MRRFALIAAFGMVVGFAATTQAAIVDFIGGGGDNWSNTANWDNAGALPGSGDIARSTATEITLDIDTAVSGLIMNGNNPNILNDGNDHVLSIGADGIDSSGGGSSISIDAGVLLTANQIWHTPDSNFHMGIGGADLFQGGGSIVLTLTGEQTRTFQGDNSFSGTIHVKQGNIHWKNTGSTNGDEFGTGTIIFGDATAPSVAVGLGQVRTGTRDLIGLTEIILRSDLLVNSFAGKGRMDVAADIPWTIDTGPIRTIVLNDSNQADSIDIRGSISDDGNGRGLRFEGNSSFDPSSESRGAMLSGENTFTGELQVAPGVTLTLDDPTGSSGDGQVLDSAVEVKLESNGSQFGVLNLVDAIDMEVAALFLDGVAQGAGTYDATTDPNYFTGSGSLTVVPEPTTAAFLALGGLMGLTGLIRRRGRS
jgi:hypothetical protein